MRPKLTTRRVVCTEVDSVAVGQQVRALRKKHNLTLVITAERTGLSVSYLSALERGLRVWNKKLLDLVSNALSIPDN